MPDLWKRQQGGCCRWFPAAAAAATVAAAAVTPAPVLATDVPAPDEAPERGSDAPVKAARCTIDEARNAAHFARISAALIEDICAVEIAS